MVLWGDEALATDHVGYYSKNVLLNSAPSAGHYHEEYPHQIGAWLYDEKYLNDEFNYEAAYPFATEFPLPLTRVPLLSIALLL